MLLQTARWALGIHLRGGNGGLIDGYTLTPSKDSLTLLQGVEDGKTLIQSSWLPKRRRLL